jgi:hypothetical protein
MLYEGKLGNQVVEVGKVEQTHMYGLIPFPAELIP